MYFFDFQDYCYPPAVIGPDALNMFTQPVGGVCADIASTFRSTRDALFSNVSQWYNVSNPTFNDDPRPCPECQVYYDSFVSLYNSYTPFWNDGENNNFANITQSDYNDYITSIYVTMNILKQLMECVDNDSFDDFII